MVLTGCYLGAVSGRFFADDDISANYKRHRPTTKCEFGHRWEKTGSRNTSTAMEAYAKQRDDAQFEQWIAEIKLRAKMRMGELSRELETAQTIPSGDGAQVRLPSSGTSKREALAEAGLSKSAANRYEELAGGRDKVAQKVAKEAIEVYIGKSKQEGLPMTEEGALAYRRGTAHSRQGGGTGSLCPEARRSAACNLDEQFQA